MAGVGRFLGIEGYNDAAALVWNKREAVVRLAIQPRLDCGSDIHCDEYVLLIGGNSRLNRRAELWCSSPRRGGFRPGGNRVLDTKCPRGAQFIHEEPQHRFADRRSCNARWKR